MFGLYYGGGAVSALYGIMSVLSFLFSHILLGVELIGFWFTYKKMNLPGWKGIIPFYNVYVLFDELWETKHFWRSLIYCGVFAVSFIIGEIFFFVGNVFSARGYRGDGFNMTSPVLLIIGLVFFAAALVMLVLAIMIYFKLYHMTAKAFGLKTAWVWGMLFVPYIIFPIIGFHKNIVYYGKVEHLEPVEEEKS